MALGDRWALEDQPFYLENTRTGLTWGSGLRLELQGMGDWGWLTPGCRQG